MKRFAALILALFMLLPLQAHAADEQRPAGRYEFSRGEERAPEVNTPAPIRGRDVISILLIGTDARDPDEDARSDVMMLVSLNRNTRQIVLSSFMRDIYTPIPGHGDNRLNAAFALGGAQCLVDTLEAGFGVDIDRYAAVDFYTFADAVDAVGGIDLELTEAEVDFINGLVCEGEQARLGLGGGEDDYIEYSDDGRYHLNGAQALAHCRNRSSAGSDFDRTLRQRTVIEALIEKARHSSPAALLSLMAALLPDVSTDLSWIECLTLLLGSGEYLSYGVKTVRVPGDGEYSGAMIDGMSVLVVDFPAAAARVQAEIGG